jgi:hypothetical protein
VAAGSGSWSSCSSSVDCCCSCLFVFLRKGDGACTCRVISNGWTSACGPSNWVTIAAVGGGGRGWRTGELGTPSTSAPMIVAVIVTDSSTLLSSSVGKVPGIGVSRLVFLVLAALDAASFLRSAFAGSERPSVSQFGSGKLNKDDFSEAESSNDLAISLDEDLDGAAAAMDLALDVLELGFGGMM